MLPCTCLVQAGQISAANEAILRSRLNEFAQREFGAPTAIRWIVIPEKSGFTAGKPSTSSVVSLAANEALDQPRRVELLKELCDLWIAETNCSIDEVVGIISDPTNN